MGKNFKHQGTMCNVVIIFHFIKIIILHTVSVKRLAVLWFNKLPFIPRGIFLCIIEVSLKRSWIKWTTARPLTIIPWTRLTGTTMEFLLESKHNMNRNERNRIQVAKVFRDTCQVSRKFWAVWETSNGCENSETKLRESRNNI